MTLNHAGLSVVDGLPAETPIAALGTRGSGHFAVGAPDIDAVVELVERA